MFFFRFLSGDLLKSNELYIHKNTKNMVHRTLHRKLKINQQDPRKNPG